MKQIEEQLIEIDARYAEEEHPLWAGKGPLKADPKWASVLKHVGKQEQGTPSGLNYEKVSAFNERYAIVSEGGKVVIVDCKSDKIEMWDVKNFKQWVASEQVRVGDKPFPIADLWLKDRDARMYQGFTFEPVDYEGDYWRASDYREGDFRFKSYNLWRGLAVEPKEGDATLFVRYIQDVLCQGDKGLAEWVTMWLADLVQRPTERGPGTAICVFGDQGSGKSFLFKFMSEILGIGPRGAALEVGEESEVFGAYNDTSASRALLGFEEAIFSGSPKLAARLKGFITASSVSYNGKYKARFTAKNIHRIIATTNEEVPVKIDSDDRRWTVIYVPENRFDTKTLKGVTERWSWWEPYYAFMKGDGPAIVLNHLLKVKVNRDVIGIPYQTAAKDDAKVGSDPILEWLDDVAATLCLPHDVDGTGRASRQSVKEAIMKISYSTGAHTSPGGIAKKIRRLVPGASETQTCTWVDPKGQEFKEVRGDYFGTADQFRAAVGRVTGKDYGFGGEWVAWGPEKPDDDGPSLPDESQRHMSYSYRRQ